jgi:hypothetical protein
MQRYVSFCTECMDEPSAKRNRARPSAPSRRSSDATRQLLAEGGVPNLALRSFARHLRTL